MRRFDPCPGSQKGEDVKYKLQLQCFFETDIELPLGVKFGDTAITNFLTQLEKIEFKGKQDSEPLFKMTMEKVEE